jgi:hypothetical protein
MSKPTLAQLQKQIEALTAQLASAKTPEAKVYQAGVVKETETLTVPKGHIAVVMPLLKEPKALRNGKDAYLAETRGTALHKPTGEGYDFNAYVIERGSI